MCTGVINWNLLIKSISEAPVNVDVAIRLFMGQQIYLSDLKRGMTVSARKAGSSIPGTANMFWIFSYNSISSLQRMAAKIKKKLRPKCRIVGRNCL